MHSSELILTAAQSIYHLDLKPGDLAEKIILVGDPARVAMISQYFHRIEVSRQKREFVTATGFYEGERISVISTGIGTDNVDIVLNEVDALFNLDFLTGKVKEQLTQLKFLRLGTCGGMQADVPVGTLVSSRYAIGGDSLIHFYQSPPNAEVEAFEQAFKTFMPDHPPGSYGSISAPDFESHLPEGVYSGITFTANGFYGPQGRSLGRIPLRYPGLPERFAAFEYGGYRLLNMEMETSAIFGLSSLLGHQAAAISVILANRRTGEFANNPPQLVEHLVNTGLRIMRDWK